MNWLNLDQNIKNYVDIFKSNAFKIKDNIVYEKPHSQKKQVINNKIFQQTHLYFNVLLNQVQKVIVI